MRDVPQRIASPANTPTLKSHGGACALAPDLVKDGPPGRRAAARAPPSSLTKPGARARIWAWGLGMTLAEGPQRVQVV
jgi:hypothetical protein